MKKDFKLNVVSDMGDPLNPTVWSSTPYHICKALENKGLIGKTFAADKTRKWKSALLRGASILHYGSSTGRVWGKFYRWNYAHNVKKQVKSAELSHTLYMGPRSISLKREPNMNSYMFIDVVWHKWASVAQEFSNISEKLFKEADELEKKACAAATHIFTTAHYVKQDVVERYNVPENKVTVVGTGRGKIQPYFGKKCYSNGKILFVAKGRFEDKGGDIVLKAFQIAQEKNPKLELTIVGQNEYVNKIKQKNVNVLGYLPFEELQKLFDTHSLFVMPAPNEPWGLVYLEALSCKIPIVGLNKRAFPELSNNGEFGYIINTLDVENLSKILIRATSNPQELEEKGEKGQIWCLENFSWENTVGKIINVIDEHYC